jgi:hypothetical protein
MVAHMIRIGHRPEPGLTVGFSSTPVIADVDDAITSSGRIDPYKGAPVGEKVWYEFTVTEADILAAHWLINTQTITYQEEGKTSQMMLEGSVQ